MKLQFLVPHYTESAEVVKPLLDSLAIQQNIDFDDIGVIMCNDGDDVVLSRTWLDTYPYRIDYFTIPHSGLSTARNACMDRATADYVMFCDCDDMFFHTYGVSFLIAEMATEFDALVSDFVEETRTSDRKHVAFITHKLDPVFVHGKVYRLEFLRENNLRFPDGLNLNEDSCFNILALELSPRTKHMAKEIYMWKWRDGSTVRREDEYCQKFFYTIVDSNAVLLDGLISRNMEQGARISFATHVIKAYRDLFGVPWEHPEYRERAIARLQQHFIGFGYLWDSLSAEDKQTIIVTIESKDPLKAIEAWFDDMVGR